MDEEDDEVKISNKVDEKQIFNMINLYFDQITTQVKEKINIELSDSKNYIFALEEELRR